MKKLLTIILAVAMLATMAVSVFASEGENSMTLTYSVAPTYTVTIPQNVTIDGQAVTLSANEVVEKKNEYVSVAIDANNVFEVTTPEGAVLPYTVLADGVEKAAGDEILAVYPGVNDSGSVSVIFGIDEAQIEYAGDYTGTAIFTISVKTIPAENE
jgi:hypothetical protein